MSLSVNTTIGASGAVETLNKTCAKTVEEVRQLSFQIAGSQTDKPVNMALDISLLHFLEIHTDQDVTLHTNAASPGQQDTFALKANNPLYWSKDAGIAIGSLFAGDVTGLYFTTTPITNITITIGIDAVP